MQCTSAVLASKNVIWNTWHRTLHDMTQSIARCRRSCKVHPTVQQLFDKAQHFPLLKRPYLNSLLSSSKLLLLVPLLDSSFVQGPPQPLHVMSSLVQLLAAAFPISLPTEQQSQAAANSKGMECSQAVQSGYCWEGAVAGGSSIPALMCCPARCSMCHLQHVRLALCAVSSMSCKHNSGLTQG